MSVKKIGIAQIDVVAGTSTLKSGLADAEQQVQKSSRAMKQQLVEDTTEARHSAMLLGEEFGVHMPRSLATLISHTNGAREAFAAAFNVLAAVGFINVLAEIPEALAKGYEKAQELTNSMRGFTEEVKKAYEEVVKLNQEAFQKPKTLGDVFSNRSQVNERITELEDEKKLLEAERQEILGQSTGKAKLIGIALDLRNVENELNDLYTARNKLNEQDADLLKNQSDLVQKQNDYWKSQVQAVKQAADERAKAYQADLSVLQKLTAAAYAPISGSNFASNANIDKQIADLQALAQRNPMMSHIVAGATAELNAQRQPVLDLQQQIDKYVASLEKLPEIIGDAGSAWTAVIGPQQQAEDLQKRITAALEAERAQEQLLQTEAQTGLQSQITLQSRLIALRQETSAQVAPMVRQFSDLANVVGGPLTEKAKQFTAQLQTMQEKGTTVAISIGQSLHNNLESAFEGLITGTESLGQAFSRMAQSILADLAKIIFETMIWKSISGIFGGLFGGGGPSIANIVGDIGSLTPHAAGGPVVAGMPYLVGENGPEAFIPGTSGTIIPNGGLGGDSYHFNIDARGSDPGAEQRIMNAVKTAVQQARRGAFLDMYEYNRRKP